MRLDKYLVEKKFFSSRARAKDAIEAGAVLVGGIVATSPDKEVQEGVSIEIKADFPWVSRGAVKLIAALDTWSIDPKGLPVLDLGASTGGFTEVLLARGANAVYAVDVGHGQLHHTLITDPRVMNMEGVDARELTPQSFPDTFSLIVGDLSFISLTKVLPVAYTLLKKRGQAVFLVKPQFEAGPGGTKKGIVRDEKRREALLHGVLEAARTVGFIPEGEIPSPIVGGSGNMEYLIHLRS